MRSSTRNTLGKRGRHVVSAEQSETGPPAPPKRSRARRAERFDIDAVVIDSSATRHCNGLLTPEPSSLTESQRPAPATDDVDITAGPVFPFMQLPAELRLHIYHMALVRNDPVPLHVERIPENTDDDDTNTFPSPPYYQTPAPALPATPVTPRRTPRPFPLPRQRIDEAERPECCSDPVVPVLLRLNKQIYKEARHLLYSENVFTLSLASGIYTLNKLHQRNRSLIKHVVLTIPSHHDILDGFADLVRLGLRYCWGLKSFRIILQASLPDDGRAGGATSVYANAFHILRWLPRGCSVVLEGCVSETVRKVVAEEGRLMNVLDETSYLKRQHQMPERH